MVPTAEPEIGGGAGDGNVRRRDSVRVRADLEGCGMDLSGQI